MGNDELWVEICVGGFGYSGAWAGLWGAVEGIGVDGDRCLR